MPPAFAGLNSFLRWGPTAYAGDPQLTLWAINMPSGVADWLNHSG